MYAFLLGLVIGANLGFIAAALCCAARHNEPFIFDDYKGRLKND